MTLGDRAATNSPSSPATNGKRAAPGCSQLSENDKLIDAMRSGVSAVAIGTILARHQDGDTYSLSGFNDALAKIHAACNM